MSYWKVFPAASSYFDSSFLEFNDRLVVACSKLLAICLKDCQVNYCSNVAYLNYNNRWASSNVAIKVKLMSGKQTRIVLEGPSFHFR